METNKIRVWFYSADAAFTEVIPRSLGAEFEAQRSDELSLITEELAGWWDVILLNLQETGNGESPPTRSPFLARLSQLEFPTPVIILLDEHNRDLARKALDGVEEPAIAVDAAPVDERGGVAAPLGHAAQPGE